jgi:predicted O-methyltransferase YrrM
VLASGDIVSTQPEPAAARPNAALLGELEALGERHDAVTADHDKRLLNITPDTGAFLGVLVRATRARRILEIGTSNGYSTLWLADAAAATGGEVFTVEHRPAKAALASATFARAVALSPIHLEVADARDVLRDAPDDRWDFIFLDADRAHYAAWWPDLRRTLAAGGLLVVDNAASHAAEVAPLVGAVTSDREFTSVLVPIGKGEFVACRSKPAYGS